MNTRTNPTTARRRRLSVSIALLATASLAACGSDEEEAASTEPRSSVEATTTEDTSTDDTSTDDTATDDTATDDTATDDTGAATTTEGTATGGTADPTGSMDSEFCATAAEAEALGDLVEPAYSGTPEELQSAVEAALEANEAALAIAPPEIADVIARISEFQEGFADVLRAHDWDFDAATTSPEAGELLADTTAVEADLDEVHAYLEETCGIEDDRDDPSGTGPTLPAGDDGLRRFIQLYAIGSGNDVTPEQEDCFVRELSGEVEVSALEEMLEGGQDQDTQMAVGLAAIACDIVTASGEPVTTTTA